MNKNMRQNLTMFSVATTIKMKNIFLNLLINTQKDILYPELSFLLRYNTISVNAHFTRFL
jgi:hypothetical protein